MNKPYISLPQFVCEIAAWLICLAALISGIVSGITIKEPIPTHFSISGQIDGYGSAWVAVLLPVVMVALAVLLSVFGHFGNPYKWNLPFKLNEKNAVYVFHDFVWMYALLELVFSLLALAYSILIVTDGSKFLVCSIMMVLVLPFIVIIPTVRASKHNKM